jgi:CrcB protein
MVGDEGRLPWGTLLANLLGAFVLGVLTVRVGRMQRPELAAALLGVGAVGAFTTFSALIGQLTTLPWTSAAAYVTVTIVLGLVAAVLGVQAGKERI